MLFCLSLWAAGIQFQLRRKRSGEKSYFIRKIPRSHKYRSQLMKALSQADNGLGLEEAPSGERSRSSPPRPAPALPAAAAGSSRQTWARPLAGPRESPSPAGAVWGRASPARILRRPPPPPPRPPLHSPPLAPPSASAPTSLSSVVDLCF